MCNNQLCSLVIDSGSCKHEDWAPYCMVAPIIQEYLLQQLQDLRAHTIRIGRSLEDWSYLRN